MTIKLGLLALLATACIVTKAMGPYVKHQFSRWGRIGSSKEVTVADKMRAKAMGPNVCVQRIPIGFQTSCVMINYRHNCTMTSHYRSVFHCCSGFTAVLKRSGCSLELYVTNLTLVEALKKMGLVTLVTLLEQTGFAKMFSGKTKFTILAPTENAFKKLGKEKLHQLMKDKKGLAKVLMYHVLKGKVLCQSENTDLGDNKLIPTMDAKSRIRVNLFFNDKLVTFNGVPVQTANQGASNGIIHVIDSVLAAPKLSGKKILADISELSLFRKALAMNGITLSKGQTVFAPTNKAFNQIDANVFGRLLRSPKCLKNLLLNHALPEPVFTTILDSSDSFGVRTKEGTAYIMRNQNGTTSIGNAKLTMFDMLAKDSVVHVIDKVLMPSSALTVQEIVRERGANIFSRLIKETGVRSLIKESGKYTIFAPTDEALKKFIGNTSFSVLSNIAEILKYHIVPKSIQTCNFKNDMIVDTLDGRNEVRINVYDYGLTNAVQGVCLGSSKCNVEACNGAVHIISEVLIPATQSLANVINTDKRFTAFAAALQRAELDWMLKKQGPLTVFAPTNTAFSKVKPKELEDLLADSQRLKNLLKYHLVHGTYFRCAFERECPVVSISGRSVLVSMSKGVININNAKLSGKEIVTTNGVIYPVDCVLSPVYRQSLFSRFWQLFS